MHLCMIRFVDNTSVARGGGELQQKKRGLDDQVRKGGEGGRSTKRSVERQVYMSERM
jgi:hypothetical protein